MNNGKYKEGNGTHSHVVLNALLNTNRTFACLIFSQVRLLKQFKRKGLA